MLGPEPEADQAEAARAVPGLRLLPTGLPLDWLADTPAEVEAASVALSALATEAGTDLVHLHSPALAAGAPCFTVPVAASCHSCVGTWWDTVRGGPLPPDFAWRARLVARGCAEADALLAPTAAFAEATARFYGLAEPPTVIRNGRRPPPPPAGRPSVVPRRPSPSPPAGCGTKARTCARSTAPRAGSPARCRCWRRGRPTALAARASPSSHARPLGRLRADEIARRLAERPIFVSAARYEPFGLSVLEAAQAGCALVLSDIPTFRELWDGAADFVPADDDRALAAAIERAARDPARLGAAARSAGRPLHGRSHGRRNRRGVPRAAPAPHRRRLAGGGRRRVKLVYFTHSLASCWNHGNAHFLRGVLRELKHAGHEVLAFEPAGAWSLQNLLRDHGDAGLDAFRAAYPDLSSRDVRAISARSEPRWTAPTR